MRPAAFELVRPRDVQEAIASLRQGGGGARWMAGGQALMRELRFRTIAPQRVVDLSCLPGLSYVREAGGVLEIGALTPLGVVADHPLVVRNCQAAAEAASRVGDVQIRNRGTIAGNLCGGWSAAGWSVDVGVALAASGGEVVVHGADGEKRIGAAEFLARRHNPEFHGEVILALRFGLAQGSAYVRLSRRYADASIGSCAAFVTRDAGHTALGLAFGRVHSHVVRAAEVEQLVRREGAESPQLSAALARFAGQLDAPDTPHAGPGYRRSVIPAIGRRAIQAALRRAISGVPS